MAVRIAVVLGYFGVLLGIGAWASRRSRGTSEDYFLASRTISPLVLFLTMAATNFSAFTVFGFAGAGWESGYAYYPIMAFGTGFMALTFVLIGRPAWHLAKEHGLVTPPELVFRLTGSPLLRLVFFVVMTVFTLPYLAMQPMAAGYALESLLGIPYFAGAAVMTIVMLLYTFRGGFRGVTRTDVLQGGMMIVLLVVAVAIVASRFGGLTAAHRAVRAEYPALFARPGCGGVYTPGVWFGYMLLWFLSDPMLPQLFQRFYVAKSPRGLTTTMSLYPLLTATLFLLPVTIGVLGRLTYPALPVGAAADRILPLMLAEHAPPVIEALVLTAALAALMSTLDSQLLTLSSMFARDVADPIRQHLRSRNGKARAVPASDELYKTHPSASAERNVRRSTVPLVRHRPGTSRRHLRSRNGNEEAVPAADEVPPWISKAFVVGLAVIGLAIAYRPPETFRALATQTFTGLAVLFPTVLAALYWRRISTAAAIASVVVGEALVVAHQFELLPRFGTLPVVSVVFATTFVLVAGSLIDRRTRRRAPSAGWSTSRRRGSVAWGATFAALFAVSIDAWNWGDGRTWLLGFPWWVWMFVGLCVITSALFWLFGRWLRRSPEEEAP